MPGAKQKIIAAAAQVVFLVAMEQESVMVVGYSTGGWGATNLLKDVKFLIPSNEEDDLSVPVPPSLIYDVNGIAITKILQNINSIFSKQELMPPNTLKEHRNALLGSLFEGVDANAVHGLFPNIAVNTLKKAQRQDYRSAGLFTSKNKPNKKKQKLSKVEKEITQEQLHGVLEQNSSTNVAYYKDDSELMHKYYSIFHEVVTKLRSAGAKNIPNQPRCKRTLFCRLLKGMNLVRRVQPHNCPHCTNLKIARTELPIVERELTACTSEEARASLLAQQAVYLKSIHVGELHNLRNAHQRGKAVDLRENMPFDTMTCYMDYLSWYTNTGKINDLVLTLERRLNASQPDCERSYVDYVSAVENTKHDSYYTTFCLKHFITQSGFVLEEGKPKKKRLIFICDNGMMSHQVVYTATKLGEEHGIQIEFLCLCPHHAWSLCDAHGGRVKSLLKRALGANEYPTAQELRDALETGIKKTRVFMVDPVDTEALDRDWFQKLRSVAGFSSFGHLVCTGTGLFHAHALYQVNEKPTPPPGAADASLGATYIFGDMQGWVDQTRCLRCSKYLGRQVFMSGHNCLFPRHRSTEQKQYDSDDESQSVAVEEGGVRFDAQGDRLWEVESIHDKQNDPASGRVQYLVKWRDWEGQEDEYEWKLHSDIKDTCKDLIADFNRSRRS